MVYGRKSSDMIRHSFGMASVIDKIIRRYKIRISIFAHEVEFLYISISDDMCSKNK